MSTSVTLVLREDKQRSDGRAPIWLRITANRKSRYLSTGINIEPKHWNENKKKVGRSHTLSTKYNESLKDQRIKAEQATMKTDTAAAAKAELQGRGGSMTAYIKKFIEALDNEGKYWEHRKYKVTLCKLKAAIHEQVDWADFDREAVTEFERYCREERKNNSNTTRKELSRLRYRMMKTDQLVEVPLPGPAQTIVERLAKAHDGPFLFPWLEKGDDKGPNHHRRRIATVNAVVNRHIKTVAKRVEISNYDEVTFHVARHSFADFARRRSGDLYAVSKALGHSSLKITERYLSSFDQDAVDRLANDLWNDE